jgi:hypothetical protein
LKDKKTVFVLGAGASCPYGYPSSTRLRERICLPEGFMQDLNFYRIHEKLPPPEDEIILQGTTKFKEAFSKSHIKSIDKFMANNPQFAEAGKYIAAFEILRAKQRSLFGEEIKFTKESFAFKQLRPAVLLNQALFQGEDWYSYLYNQLIEELVGKNVLPDFSKGNLAFITFNYDRSLEQFLYESLRNSYTEVSEEKIIETLRQLKILHVYGQVAPLKWQDSSNFMDYKSQLNESLLQNAAKNIKTIYEEKQNPELDKAKGLLMQASQIFFLGFGYAKENMDVLGLPQIIPPGNCMVYGTAFGLCKAEIGRVKNRIIQGLTPDSLGLKNVPRVVIEPTDCLELLRNYFEY